ncbi:hypothetical protein [Alteribacter populi]|uniref:hypothetical protein n=1 Tax=Alteribacter populi TaxID=2011011 RepID=UPI000BBA6D28|nr:hypothetical protein [Alteribacter populi]
MSNKKSLQEFISLLGVQSESQLNKLVHQRLEDPRTIKKTRSRMQNHANSLKKLRDYTEILALQLNMPTKDDIANVTKIAIQIEEKLDDLEEKILLLAKEQEKISEDTDRDAVQKPSKGALRVGNKKIK